MGSGGTSVRNRQPQEFFNREGISVLPGFTFVISAECWDSSFTCCSVGDSSSGLNIPAHGKFLGMTPRSLSAFSDSIRERASLATYTSCLVYLPFDDTSKKSAPSTLTGELVIPLTDIPVRTKNETSIPNAESKSDLCTSVCQARCCYCVPVDPLSTFTTQEFSISGVDFN